MSDIAISVENLGKLYHIGATQKRHDTLRDVIVDWGLGIRDRMGRLARPTSNIQPPTSNSIWALQDVSFEVKRGEVVGIIGRNGAGKSTLLKILSRITEPTKGRAIIDGRVGSLLEVGTGFHPELTGRENIYLNGAILGMRKAEIERKFDEIVAFAEIEKFLDTPVKHYSSGMYVRLAFAVAAHLDPEILVVDEVLAVGDAAFQKKCLRRMEDISHGYGRTILFVSHNMAAIASTCSRAVFLQCGSVIGDGAVHAIIGQYQESWGGRQDSFVDLSNWVHRRGRGEFARFQSASLFDLQDAPCDVIQMGQGLKIRLRIRFSRAVITPEIGVAITNLLGQRITHIVSAWEGLLQPVDVGEYLYEITIPRLMLVPGLYALILWVKRQGNRGGWPHDDVIEGALNFQIVGRDIDGHAPYLEVYCQPGEIYVDSHWKVERV